MKNPRLRLTALLLAGALLAPAAARAQQEDCTLFCSPKLLLEPGLTVSNVFGQPEVRKLSTGAVHEIPRETSFLMTLTTEVPTEIPRTSLIFSLQWTPFADTDENAYTGYTADELDEEEVNANSLTLQAGPSVKLLTFDQTSGIYATSVSVMDLISPAREPGDARNFTHKLLLEWEGLWGVFNWLPKGTWLRNVELYTTLQYVATGLPNEGDVVPDGAREWLDDASGWTYQTGLNLPLAPLVPK